MDMENKRFEKRSHKIAFPMIEKNSYSLKFTDLVNFKKALLLLQENQFELFTDDISSGIIAPEQPRRSRYNYDLERDLTALFPEDDDDNILNDDLNDPMNRPTSKHRLHLSAEIRPKKRRRSAQ